MVRSLFVCSHGMFEQVPREGCEGWGWEAAKHASCDCSGRLHTNWIYYLINSGKVHVCNNLAANMLLKNPLLLAVN